MRLLFMQNQLITDFSETLGLQSFPVTLIAWIIGIAIAVGCLAGVGIYFWYSYVVYNRKIVIFTDVNGRPEIVGRDRGRIVPLGKSGDQLLYVRKNKKYLPVPQMQTGRLSYWYWVREDGEWFNIGLRHVDEQFREINARFLDKEMRYARTQLQHKIDERYNKPSFWEKYGTIVVSIVSMFIIFIFLFLIIREMGALAGSVRGAVETSREVLQESARLLGAIDQLQGGSGLQPAG